MIRVPRKRGSCEECHFHTGSKVDYPCPYHRGLDGGWRARPPWITEAMEQALRPAWDHTSLYWGWVNATPTQVGYEVLRRHGAHD
jgi:hypothetical protein